MAGSSALRVALVAVCLCVLSHFLCSYEVAGIPLHDYAYVVACDALALATGDGEGFVMAVARIVCGFPDGVSADTLFSDAESVSPVNLLARVVPVVMAFLCLTGYGLAAAWQQRRRPKLLAERRTDPLWVVIFSGAALIVCYGCVFCAAYLTVPCRWRSLSYAWTPQDLREHYEDMVVQQKRNLAADPGDAPGHFMLGRGTFEVGSI